ncbi:MAG TPA: amidohydrolase, partial [Aquamicrobium sp.]|nr:amidohydrolase [Aquamicrobium sp.]
MPILNRAAELHDEVTGWRRHLHAAPELLYEVHGTAAFVAARLAEFGCDEVVTGIGRTGVVGLIRGGLGDGATIGLRADMDALPLTEITGKPWASRTPGRMHACGHDGHTAMLLGAAKYLAETRAFAGTVAVIFQPAEEGGAGARAMIEDGLMERFGIARVFGMHNMPGLPVGYFAINPGPIMAATAEFAITVEGKGGHAAMPHTTLDPVAAASQLVLALQTVVSRTVDPLDSAVVSVTKFHAGDAYNVIPQKAQLAGTVRTLRDEVAEAVFARIRAICDGIAAAAGVQIGLRIDVNYPVTRNDPAEAAFAAE